MGVSRMARPKNAALFLVAALFALAMAEIAVRAFDLFATERREALLPSVTEDRQDDATATPYLIHPFLGWSLRPALAPLQMRQELHLIFPDGSSLNLGSMPTSHVSWDQPHEGNLFEHLYRQRAIQPPEIAA